MKNVSMELVKEFDGTYCMNMAIGGQLVTGLPEHTTYTNIKKVAKAEYNLSLPRLSEFKFEKCGRKRYGYVVQ